MERSTWLGTRPSLEVMDIFHLHGEEYKNHYPLSLEQRKAMADITRCRTASLGGHVDVCDQDCGFTRISYNSCRNCWRRSEGTENGGTVPLIFVKQIEHSDESSPSEAVVPSREGS